MMASEAAAASATYGLCHHAALQTRERRASECSSGSENDAGTARDTPDLHALLRACNVLAAAFLMCSILSFNSSAYTCAGSALDALLVMSDVVCIDVSSALFVLAGSALGTLLEESAPAQRTGLARVIAGAILLDLYIATFCALLLGSVHALVLARFRWRDVAFTALEGLTTLRALDFQQSAATPHSYNVAAWPAQSLLWCVLGAQGLQTLDARLAARLPALADAIVCVAALLGIVLFTAFGSMQATSNIFYANACSVKYRSLEFNLGVHAVFLFAGTSPSSRCCGASAGTRRAAWRCSSRPCGSPRSAARCPRRTRARACACTTATPACRRTTASCCAAAGSRSFCSCTPAPARHQPRSTWRARCA